MRQGTQEVRIPSVTSNLRVFDAETYEEIPIAIRRDMTIQNRSEAFTAMFDAVRQQNFSDVLYILDEENTVQYELTLNPHEGGQLFRPMAGDLVEIAQGSRFTSADAYEFVIDASQNVAKEDLQLASERLAQIRVVPNPYIVTNLAERRPTPVRPQQERQLHFINLPAQCTIRIFNVAGHLIQTLEVNNSIDNGLKVWDMLTKDNLDLAYGVYIYHVEAPGVGEHTGKFAVIK
jgi:hypothetical protein